MIDICLNGGRGWSPITSGDGEASFEEPTPFATAGPAFQIRQARAMSARSHEGSLWTMADELTSFLVAAEGV